MINNKYYTNNQVAKLDAEAETENKAYLILCNLHIEDNVIDEFRKSFPNCALKFIVIQQCVHKFKDTEDQVLKAKDFSCTEGHKICCDSLYFTMSIAIVMNFCTQATYHQSQQDHPLLLCSWPLFSRK